MGSGMNEQYEALKSFRKELIDFNEGLSESSRALARSLEQVSPLWQEEDDDMRRHFDSIWAPFRESIRRYVRNEGPSYVEWITLKLHQTGKYLGR